MTINSNYLSITDSVTSLSSVWDNLLTISGEDARYQGKSEDCQTKMAREIAILIKDGHLIFFLIFSKNIIKTLKI